MTSRCYVRQREVTLGPISWSPLGKRILLTYFSHFHSSVNEFDAFSQKLKTELKL